METTAKINKMSSEGGRNTPHRPFQYIGESHQGYPFYSQCRQSFSGNHFPHRSIYPLYTQADMTSKQNMSDSRMQLMQVQEPNQGVVRSTANGEDLLLKAEIKPKAPVELVAKSFADSSTTPNPETTNREIRAKEIPDLNRNNHLPRTGSKIAQQRHGHWEFPLAQLGEWEPPPIVPTVGGSSSSRAAPLNIDIAPGAQGTSDNSGANQKYEHLLMHAEPIVPKRPTMLDVPRKTLIEKREAFIAIDERIPSSSTSILKRKRATLDCILLDLRIDAATQTDW